MLSSPPPLELEELLLLELELGELLLLELELGELLLLELELLLLLLLLLDWALELFPFCFFLLCDLLCVISCCSPSRVNRKGLELALRGASLLAS